MSNYNSMPAAITFDRVTNQDARTALCTIQAALVTAPNSATATAAGRLLIDIAHICERVDSDTVANIDEATGYSDVTNEGCTVALRRLEDLIAHLPDYEPDGYARAALTELAVRVNESLQ